MSIIFFFSLNIFPFFSSYFFFPFSIFTSFFPSFLCLNDRSILFSFSFLIFTFYLSLYIFIFSIFDNQLLSPSSYFQKTFSLFILFPTFRANSFLHYTHTHVVFLFLSHWLNSIITEELFLLLHANNLLPIHL